MAVPQASRRPTRINIIMARTQLLSSHGQKLLEAIENTSFDRYGSGNGCEAGTEVSSNLVPLYSGGELIEIQGLEGTPRDVAARMPIRVTQWYADLARRSVACRNLVKARVSETADLSGRPLPIDQATHSPGQGIAHLYPQIVRFHVVNTCSAHCRYCNQHHALSHPRTPVPSPQQAADYVRRRHALAGSAPLTEALLSGGDPMVLPNTKLFEYFVWLAEAGVSTIRVGTKELSFFPHRFNSSFFAALDAFHQTYPAVAVCFVVHFSHPDEFLDGANGAYEEDAGRPRWRPQVRQAVDELLARSFVTILNQTPIIRSVNDSADALRTLQRALSARRIVNYYMFQCRLIQGYRVFSVPVEETAAIVQTSQVGLTGREATARLVMSTRLGKLEVLCGSTETMFRVLRSPTGQEGVVIRANRNPDAHWVSDYRDRLIIDETGKVLMYGEEV
jgi:lysine 2,3-aminomutase